MPANTVTDLFNTQAHNPSFRRICASLESSTDLVDFCVPVNCYFPPAELLEEIRHALPEIVKYYPDYVETHQTALSKLAQVPTENIVVANGSTELITLLCQNALRPLTTSIPTFGQWTDLPKTAPGRVLFHPARKRIRLRLNGGENCCTRTQTQSENTGFIKPEQSYRCSAGLR